MNHGAGRAMGRKAADRTLDQKTVDEEFAPNDILTNCRRYPNAESLLFMPYYQQNQPLRR